ncbi:UDP-4-amino-4,6-dideoxy-N-acetyl-beta-L-altrosamine transaminase [Shewanella sp. JM162201]|uniref:UDP-4-amino-4, 6-dideoxy-N-acetyl-beta-L-altrosamine transaminase n=1 Tax=Shewanella jiangmenensis TaxID=2837387 RepID=A0ABS5V549_9GAMM|nr:UDP-4-amino-4,6-dideoxy-N-acetyl-beta-L-altrosamine transaminase [Shewanella jiangmenensis]MBT1444926.1 UDP-4-amino-4,6-dideoxy-N-acetyl-beta-L-altrosamine transaminase [Shewanella jiangmenensis]
MIPYGKQDISQADIDAVVEVLKSDWLTQGPEVPAFEKAVCDYTGAKHAVAVNSATSALHIACLALGVGAGDVVWTSPITFVASANCALYCGADVDFVDVDAATGNMCPKALELKLVAAKANGRLPKVVIPVHLCGHSCDMAPIAALASEYGFKLIEDASHAIGGSYQGKRIGSCAFSDITVFSFHPVKIVTSAEGGMALTNSSELAEKMELLRSHGITKAASLMTRPNEGDWYYEQLQLGFNYRMTDLQAALGLSQMARLETFVQTRNELACTYRDVLAQLSASVVEPLSGSHSAWHLMIVCLDVSAQRRRLFDEMRRMGIQVHVHYFPVYLQPYYQSHYQFQEGYCPRAEQFYQSILTLPLHCHLTDTSVNFIVSQLKALMDSTVNSEGGH